MTAMPSVELFIQALRAEGAGLAAAAERTPWDAPVPTCTEWLLRDLVLHTGRVHRWAASFVRTGRREPLDESAEREVLGPTPPDEQLAAWYRESHAGLVEELEKAPADLDCRTLFPAPSPLAFWSRRQAHETAVHRFDAEAASGVEPAPPESWFAADGIDELLRGFVLHRRPSRTLRSPEPRTLAVHAEDAAPGEGDWLLTITDRPAVVERRAGRADCTLRGSAGDLYLLLWNRIPLDRVTCEGDPSVFSLWRDKAQIT
jgi:uncharacterized protein (TIGR03083 family)